MAKYTPLYSAKRRIFYMYWQILFRFIVFIRLTIPEKVDTF